MKKKKSTIISNLIEMRLLINEFGAANSVFKTKRPVKFLEVRKKIYEQGRIKTLEGGR